MGPAFPEPVPDPVLELVGTPALGSSITWRVWGEPGALVRLDVGLAPQLVDDGVAIVELLVRQDLQFVLGAIPAQGYVEFVLPAMPATAAATLWAQAEVDLGASDVRRTNSSAAFLAIPVP